MMAHLLNYIISLAHRLIGNQDDISPAYSYLSRSFNAGCVSACAPRKASPETHRFGVALLANGITIYGEARLKPLRFRSRRDII